MLIWYVLYDNKNRGTFYNLQNSFVNNFIPVKYFFSARCYYGKKDS